MENAEPIIKALSLDIYELGIFIVIAGTFVFTFICMFVFLICDVKGSEKKTADNISVIANTQEYQVKWDERAEKKLDKILSELKEIRDAL